LLATEDAVVRRVRADNPADSELIELLVAGEPVHPFGGQADVADRFADDRRCFVLEHPLLPDRPLNVVFVALWNGTPRCITDILDTTAPTAEPSSATTAVFYSIWNVEPGARGLDGGRQLIEGAVAAVQAELPAITTCVTLSPIPGFCRWIAEGETTEELDASHPDLLRWCARYLTEVTNGRPTDPVAGFHLGNGARLIGLHRHADPSVRGQRRSWEVMANYRYVPESRENNRAELARGHASRSAEIDAMLSSD